MRKTKFSWIAKIFFPFAFLAAIFYLFVYPFLIASKTLQANTFAICFGIFLYIQLLMITAEYLYMTFAGLYNFRRKQLFRFIRPRKASEEESVLPRGLVFFTTLFSYFFFIYSFALAYLFTSNFSNSAFDKSPISFIDALFLSFTSISVGPSGIQPTSTLTKVLVMSEVLIGLVYTILVFSLITSLIKNDAGRSSS